MNEYEVLSKEFEGQSFMTMAPLRKRWLRAAVETYEGVPTDGGRAWRRRLVSRMRQEDGYGNPLLLIILVPLAQVAIKWLIEWLMSRRENTALMESWHAS